MQLHQHLECTQTIFSNKLMQTQILKPIMLTTQLFGYCM